MNEEFDNDDYPDDLDAALANFDVEKAVQQHQQQKPQQRKPPPSTSMDTTITPVEEEEQEEEEQAAKKRKVSLSPSAGGTTAKEPTTNNSNNSNKNNNAHDLDATTVQALRKTLQRIFGYTDFRPGQAEVISALLQKRDVSVYWATGQGKSLCYQIPALHWAAGDQAPVALVVSPLISLMQDQCHKLNALSNNHHLATYLGSAQMDRQQEELAWQGAFRVVYLTPEKLVNSLDHVARLHCNNRIAVIAIDEAHTVSEWGTDFRPDFRQLSRIRQHDGLRDIPLLTLTATAVPRVQDDITTVLQLRAPFVSRQSLNRKNLHLSCLPRTGNNVVATLQPYIALWQSASTWRAAQNECTIIYVATRKLVDQVTAALHAQLCHGDNGIATVRPYHAGLSAAERQAAHTAFLTGRCTVLVATVAFGMGIDKPDTRRIIHYGPPKNMEEYYQQIGRAGRDGAPAQAVLFYGNQQADFDKYQDDFYVGRLPPRVKQANLESLQALKDYCLNASSCRRKLLLTYFGEKPTFTHCRNCDYCHHLETYGDDDMERDFRHAGASLILFVVDCLREQAAGQITKALNGNAIDSYRCKIPVSQLQARVAEARAALPRKYAVAYFEQLLTSLLQKKYVFTRQVKKQTASGYSNSWMVYGLTPQGKEALDNDSKPICLPVPEYLRELERKEQERREKVLQDLQKSNFKDKIPSDELEQGDGEVIRAYSKWQNYVETARGLGRSERVEQLESLLSSIENWRADTATKNQMAPVSVVPEHILVNMAYAVASLPAGNKMDAASLVAAGVRSREIDSLTTVLGEWVDECQPKVQVDTIDSQEDSPMTTTKIPTRPPWKFAVYKPQKKNGKAAFELSYDRYVNGESIESIAMSPAPGRQPIQVKTVAGHVVDAIVHGRPVDVVGLVSVFPLPTRVEWEKLEQAHTAAGMDPMGDPDKSGVEGGKYLLYDAIRPMCSAVDTPKEERTDADRAVIGHWVDKLKWFLALKRGGVQPKFE